MAKHGFNEQEPNIRQHALGNLAIDRYPALNKGTCCRFGGAM